MKNERIKLQDKNGITINTGDTVRITGGYFQKDNGDFKVTRSPGDINWNSSDYSLRRLTKNGQESTAKGRTAFWPIMVTTSSWNTRATAREHNRRYATIEIIAQANREGGEAE